MDDLRSFRGEDSSSGDFILGGLGLLNEWDAADRAVHHDVNEAHAAKKTLYSTAGARDKWKFLHLTTLISRACFERKGLAID